MSCKPTKQTNIQFFTGRMPFLSHSQQCQSTEGKISHSIDLPQAHLAQKAGCLQAPNIGIQAALTAHSRSASVMLWMVRTSHCKYCWRRMGSCHRHNLQSCLWHTWLHHFEATGLVWWAKLRSQCTSTSHATIRWAWINDENSSSENAAYCKARQKAQLRLLEMKNKWWQDKAYEL